MPVNIILKRKFTLDDLETFKGFVSLKGANKLTWVEKLKFGSRPPLQLEKGEYTSMSVS